MAWPHGHFSIDPASGREEKNVVGGFDVLDDHRDIVSSEPYSKIIADSSESTCCSPFVSLRIHHFILTTIPLIYVHDDYFEVVAIPTIRVGSALKE